MKVSVNGFDFDLELKSDYGFYLLLAKKLNSDKEIGSLSFFFKNQDRERVSWLNKIEVEKKYQAKGVGYGLLKVFEQFSASRQYLTIEGKYYPTNERAKQFYLRNGYMIYREGYNQELFKRLDKNVVQAEYNRLVPSGETISLSNEEEKE